MRGRERGCEAGPGGDLRAFEPYAASLEHLLHRLTGSCDASPDDSQLSAVLDGQPGEKLRELVAPALRRARGAFFTTKRLREVAMRHISPSISDSSIVLDPACGAGDLLLATVPYLPPAEDLPSTLERWGDRLWGIDLQHVLVRVAHARLSLAAASQCLPSSQALRLIPAGLFPNIRVGDGLDAHEHVQRASHLLLNPPYTKMLAPEGCLWAAGKVSAAAVFLETCLSQAAQHTHVFAILPDVLRTGSSYERWRRRIGAIGSVEAVEVLDRFDPETDVDVFGIHLIARPPAAALVAWWEPGGARATRCVGDHFQVSVGRVVPHRHHPRGPSRPYLYPRQLGEHAEFDVAKAERRCYHGHAWTPPFVAVRRTSRPDRKRRILATLITGTEPVAVENHLMICTPRDGSLDTCRRLLAVLASLGSRTWLDQRIRCRHLTVTALRELPWENALGER